jgi:methionyl-tRNA formyltransferase
MNIVIITQDEPFYLVDNLEYLINNIPEHSKVVACIVNDVSPFGKKETFLEKAKKTYNIFGLNFFLHYAFKFLKSKLNRSKNINTLLSKKKIDKIILEETINSQSSIEIIKAYKPDLLVSILGNQIFKEPILTLAPKGCINLHTALLPKYRGLMPSFWVLKNNEKETGISVFFVDEGIDSGEIIVQERVEIGDRTQEELIVYTKKLGMKAIIKSIDLINRDEVQLIPNDASLKSYFSFPTKEDVAEFKKQGKRFF